MFEQCWYFLSLIFEEYTISNLMFGKIRMEDSYFKKGIDVGRCNTSSVNTSSADISNVDTSSFNTRYL